MTIEINQKLPVSKFSLSVEELALLLGMIGQVEQGQVLLKIAHPNLDKLDMDSLLSSAGHSLLARGFCQLSLKDELVIHQDLEKAAGVLNNYDQIFHLNMMSGSNPLNMTIQAIASKSFCSRFNKTNIVHLLEYGLYRDLSKYLASMLDVITTDDTPVGVEIPLTLSVLTTALEGKKNHTEIKALLREAGWLDEQAALLAEDLLKQIVRGSLSRIDHANVTTSGELAALPKTGLLFLRGLKRSWMFRFASLETDAVGKAQLVDKKTFKKAIGEFVQ